MNTLEPIIINTSEISLTMSCEDIYEALRFCAIEKKCTRCPLFSITDCDSVLMPAVFEMVNRQKAEIERLTSYNENLIAANSDITNKLWDEVEEAKSEAIKEFAESVKKNRRAILYAIYDRTEYSNIVDNLVKEMTEEKE